MKICLQAGGGIGGVLVAGGKEGQSEVHGCGESRRGDSPGTGDLYNDEVGEYKACYFSGVIV
jgi:hypothetical protein